MFVYVLHPCGTFLNILLKFDNNKLPYKFIVLYTISNVYIYDISLSHDQLLIVERRGDHSSPGSRLHMAFFEAGTSSDCSSRGSAQVGRRAKGGGEEYTPNDDDNMMITC